MPSALRPPPSALRPHHHPARRISSRQRKLRVAHRYSQSEMAELVGTSQPTYCRWRSGKALMKAKLYKTIARLCGLPLREVLPPELRDGEG